MKVYFHAEGLIKTYYKNKLGIVELEDGSTLEDFCIKVNELSGEGAKHSIWNNQKKRFRGPVAVSVNGEIIKDLSYKLQNDQTVKLVYYIVGG